jgi:hypothetical protein
VEQSAPVITLEKLRIYSRYKGDGDLFSRAGSKRERESMHGADWELIDTLLQDATVLNRNLGSEERNNQALRRLRSGCENDEVVSKILSLAENL